MIIDNTLIFSDSQAITADAGSTNIIDLGAAGTAYGASSPVRRDVGEATNIPINVTVTEAFNNLTSLQLSLQVDDDVAFGSPTTVAMGPVVTLASGQLAVGKQLQWPAFLPPGTNERYVRIFYDVTGTAPTTGKIHAAIVAGRQAN